MSGRKSANWKGPRRPLPKDKRDGTYHGHSNVPWPTLADGFQITPGAPLEVVLEGEAGKVYQGTVAGPPGWTESRGWTLPVRFPGVKELVECSVTHLNRAGGPGDPRSET